MHSYLLLNNTIYPALSRINKPHSSSDSCDFIFYFFFWYGLYFVSNDHTSNNLRSENEKVTSFNQVIQRFNADFDNCQNGHKKLPYHTFRLTDYKSNYARAIKRLISRFIKLLTNCYKLMAVKRQTINKTPKNPKYQRAPPTLVKFGTRKVKFTVV